MRSRGPKEDLKLNHRGQAGRSGKSASLWKLSRLSLPFLFLLTIFLLSLPPLSAQVLINEVCYDPADADTGREWIELYNAGSQDAHLLGAQIQWGGSTFAQSFELPQFTLRPGRYLLLGGELVAEAAITITTLTLQNAISETDGVRYVSPDELYTDTVLYGAPNSNALPDDTGAAGTSFAEDAPGGCSLARTVNGVDTNDCAADFHVETNPSPGLPNLVAVDYALLHPLVWQDDGDWKLSLWVKNLSAWTASSTASLSIALDAVQVASDIVTPLAAGDSLYILNFLPVADELDHQLLLELELAGDPDTSNNSLSLSLLQQQAGLPLLNEVLYQPATGQQEWIELWLPAAASRADYTVSDAADNHFSFSLPALSGYYVLCTDSLQLLADYPDCPATAVLKVSGWAPLNNSGDSIYLSDSEGTILDQMSYVGQSAMQGKSLERYLDGNQEPAWRYSLAAAGATPGQPNSQNAPPPQFSGTLKLEGSPLKLGSGDAISLWYQLDAADNFLNCSVFDRAGNCVAVLADNLALPAAGSLTWSGRASGGGYLPRGLYFILWESRAASGGKILRKQLSAVLYD